MPLEKLNSQYFSKSKVFLFPALGLKKSIFSKELLTFIAWEKRYNINDKRLIVVKQGGIDNRKFREFSTSSLLVNKLYEEMIFVREDVLAYVFNLEKCAGDWNTFLSGRYSKLSVGLKENIKMYFSEHPVSWECVRSYLYPEKYFDIYAALLYDEKDRYIGRKIINSVGELCNPFDPDKELFSIIPTMKEISQRLN